MSNRDPVGALIGYVEYMKPYHSKIAEVLIEYIYTDMANVTALEKLDWELDFIYETNALECDEGFGALPYGDLIRAGTRRINPFYNLMSGFYRSDLDINSSNYDPNWINQSPAPSNRELIVSLIEYPVNNIELIVNPFYDPQDPDYDPALDVSSSVYDPLAFDQPFVGEFTLATSLQYPYPSATQEGKAIAITNPFYDSNSSEYIPELDANNPNYDPGLDPSTYTLLEQSTSVTTIEVFGSPVNPFRDITSPTYVPIIDRHSQLFDESINSSAYSKNEQASSLVFFPYVEDSIESNWENGVCPESDPALMSGVFIDELNSDTMLERSGNFQNDFNVLFDRFNLFNYNADRTEITQTVISSTSPLEFAIAKANFTAPADGNVYFWEYTLLTTGPDTITLGIFSYDLDVYNIPYEVGEADNTIPLNEFTDNVSYDSTGNVWVNGTIIETVNTFSQGDTVGMRLDTGSNSITFYLNGTAVSTQPYAFSNVTSGASVVANGNGSKIELITTANDLTFPQVGDQAIPLNT